MWEIFTEGRMPFEKNTNYEVVTMVTRGHRLPRPKLASKYLYEVMLRCWQEVRLFVCVSSGSWLAGGWGVQFLQLSEGAPPALGCQTLARSFTLVLNFERNLKKQTTLTVSLILRLMLPSPVGAPPQPGP